MAADNRKLKPMENGDVPKRKKISTLGQVKSTDELLAQYKIKRETFQQEHTDVFRAQGVNNQARKQPVLIEEDACEDQTPKMKKKRKIQRMSLLQESVDNNGNHLRAAAEKNTNTGLHSKDGADQNFQAVNYSKVAAEMNMKTAGNQTTVETESNSNPKSGTAELSANPTKGGMTLDMYFKVHGIDLDNEEDEDVVYNDHVEDAENEEGIKKKNHRGKTKCSKIHNAPFSDRQEVQFLAGQPIGPTEKVVSNLSSFLGTVVRNPTFMDLLYTSWHGVPSSNKEDMWVYVNKKFILPSDSKEWIMEKLCDAWKKYKGEVKKFHFKKYRTKKEMMKNRPLDMPEIQFRKLIRYWSLPEIMAKSNKNTESRSKQTCPHRMGSTNFGIVRKQLRESKENHEEPTRAEMFTATRTSKKGKEVDVKTQAVIDEIQHRIEAGEDDEDAFISVLGKDQPGRLRCYGGGITKSSLKNAEAVRQVQVECDKKVLSVQVECDKKVLSLQNQVNSMQGILKMMMKQMNPAMTDEDVAALLQVQHNSPPDASSGPEVTPNPRSSESTHLPQQE